MTGYLTVREVAELASITTKSVRRAIVRGDLRAVRPKGQRTILIARESVEAWMEPVEPKTPGPPAPASVRSRAGGHGSADRLRAIEEGQ